MKITNCKTENIGHKPMHTTGFIISFERFSHGQVKITVSLSELQNYIHGAKNKEKAMCYHDNGLLVRRDPQSH